MKPETNYRRKWENNKQVENKPTLKNQWVNARNQEEIRKHLKTNENQQQYSKNLKIVMDWERNFTVTLAFSRSKKSLSKQSNILPKK